MCILCATRIEAARAPLWIKASRFTGYVVWKMRLIDSQTKSPHTNGPPTRKKTKKQQPSRVRTPAHCRSGAARSCPSPAATAGMHAAMSPSTPPMGKASAAAGARLMEDVERALARVDPSASHAGASPSQRRVVTALHGTRGLARLDLERRLVSRAACDALAELQRRLDAAKAETRDAVAACRVARAETETAARDRETERREWLANRDAVRKEIALARDRVAAVKDEHRDVLLELERERRNVKLAGEETSAARDELARASDANELLKRRLARARAEIANARAEIAARDDAVDTALAANARNAAIAAREALKRTDEEVFPLINNGGIRSRSTSAQKNLGETNCFSDDEDERLVRAGRKIGTDPRRVSAPPSPSAPTTVSQTTRSRADWARAYAELVTEVDAARARAEKAESALDQSARSANEPNRANANVDACDWETRALAAEAKVAKLARLNAGLLDRLGEAVGAAPTSARSAKRALAETVSETVSETATTAENARETYDGQTSVNDSDSERLRSIESLRALESEVKAMDAAYRETMEAIARESAVPGSENDPNAARRLDAAAARANALEDAIVRKVEEVQRLRELTA